MFSPRKNPAFEFCDVKCWVARSGGRIVGRAAGIINHRSNDIRGEKKARFGWIDFIDDLDVSKKLLSTVEEWARSLGMDAVHGPLGFTDLDPEGRLVDGFDELGTIATIYNHPYYPAHLEELGYVKDVDWVEFEILVPEEMPERVTRVAEIARKRHHLRVYEARKTRDLLQFKGEVFSLLNESFANLYGFVPLTEQQIEMYASKYFNFLQPKFVSIVLDREDKVAAFGITMPSLSRAFQRCRGRLLPLGLIHVLRAMRRNDRADMYLVAVRPSLQGQGVNALLLEQVGHAYREVGVRRTETNPELEHNARVITQWKAFDHRQHKRRRCFVKRLGHGEDGVAPV
jgi:GNAT superfamily N-acetyltransferase